MAVPGGFFYLAIAPRMALILGLYDLVRHIITERQQHPNLSISAVIANHESKHWQSRTEFWDLLLNNVCVISSWILLSNWLGAGFFLSVYSLVVTLSAVVFIWVFFVQHIFEGSYAHKTADWDYLTGAIEGSSYLELPAILKWFTADIGYHNIHHLSERIPNYHLEACHRENLHLLANVKTLRMGDMLDCANFILWDADSNSLVSIESFLRNESAPTELTPVVAMSVK